MNDDLVAKKFALYDSQLAAGYELEEVEQEPVMLPATVLTQSARTTRAPGKGTNQEVVGFLSGQTGLLVKIHVS